MTTLYDFQATKLSGEEVSLSAYQGRVVLVVNTASKCGFTPQYEGLEAVYKAYQFHGFTVLGFPCNQFGAQEPGNAYEIASFCQANYGVSFPMFAKVEVNGPGAHPLFQFLKKAKPGLFGSSIRWNFTKFLIGRDGVPLRRFAPTKTPVKIALAIEKALG
ncbi:glutathione peroxidase [Rhizomicrobium palustre]|jgi:glutathione peroxidase|uniref:Glutathione peroxidase n=1 Tax=Rhizomicrobium palustre TaxID=189966 RepID=A0A846MW28_9PROT|nr:glutathione peroxidase [Rhizomicrobium palustre]NIK87282.1 glutathione peroxidase [Rhizomicrobium palustre]